MKKVLAFLFAAVTGTVFSQLTTTNPDTVCYQSGTLSQYTVTSVGNGNYNWTLPACATIASGQGTNSIMVNWSNCPPGLTTNAVSVVYTSPQGCSSPPVNLNVLIYNVVPTITAIGPFCSTDPCVPLTGTPAGGVWAGIGVVNGQFCPGTAGAGTSTISYLYTQSGCSFSTSVNVVVNPQPTLTPISHN